MNRKLNLILMILVTLTLTACAGTGKKDGGSVGGDANESTAGNTSAPLVDNNVGGTGLSADQLASIGIMGDPLQYNTVYFEYNSTAIDRRSDVIARAHAREIARRGGANASQEGHADERGTRDFNLALGERRAQAVASLMASEAAVGTPKAISYGEERPANAEHNEAAWQQNRRVVISY